MSVVVGRGRVSVAPLRKAFLRMEPGVHGWSLYSCKDAGQIVASRLGWYDHNGVLDGARVRRVLGLRPYQDGHGKRSRRYVDLETALRLCEAMGLDPVDFDL